MWKKAIAIFAVLGIGVGLAVWGAGPRAIATTDDGNVKETTYYNELKKTQVGQQTLANMVVMKVLDKNYGGDVSKQEIDQQYQATKKQLGDAFEQQLTQSGMTPEMFRNSIKLQLLERQAVRANVKISNKQLKQAYQDYQPKTQVSVILVDDEDKAKDVIKKLDDGDKFTDLVKSESKDGTSKDKKGQLEAFDSTSTTVEDSVKKAAFALKPGEYTKEPVKSENSNGYYIIKQDSQEKKPSFDKLKSTLKESLLEKDMNNQDVVNAIVGEELGKANVQIKDPELKNALATYTQAAAKKKAEAVKAHQKATKADEK
ncbi:peptidylprolyl isomerase [Weissella halotolerans]|uniref:Foldase protein PrsA n=1 Tax=Weissella halotolerans DSM 20190 TaxID=1123500 RepID=A0A0R2G1D6_9LACO|nr:peptidylprolyl isomerase [Weissella halotolerans]KRN33254.1 peptidylprolyl isomerase [Weissella halotolerans DSM 20190]